MQAYAHNSQWLRGNIVQVDQKAFAEATALASVGDRSSNFAVASFACTIRYPL